ncbi:MAG: double-strand break repair helicase AddA [Alphaproteobacteria bacterium]|nr:double-strand break repair helicase AddA [Alphaproteobacteria bacterium]
MSGPRRQVPGETARLQASAADPKNSVWVSANAGAGKTHVLAQRVIRLLLSGTDPSRILCLTYTRAAAANMSNRVFSNLSEWTMLDDAKLAKKILELEGIAPDAARLRTARRLFAEALETPGGLKIQTIHAFCEAVLHQFPLEANIAAQFEMLDQRMEQMLFSMARREMLTGAVAGNAGLAEAFATVLERGGEFGLDLLLQEIVRRRDGLRAFIDEGLSGDTGPQSPLFDEFGFQPGETAGQIAGAVWPLPGFAPSEFERFVAEAEACDARSVLNNILPHATLGFAEPDPERRLKHFAKGFLKADGDPYDPTKAFKKALLAAMPDLPERYAAAAAAITAAMDRLTLFRMLEGTRAALVVADWMIGRYEQLKSARGLLDFNDLITRTVRLLARQDAGAWVQYKLDQGIDHILLDEAQDTSPDQWDVVRRLAGEFFAGEGSRDDVLRTVFAVGDEKQSIYSFQGASPESFAETGIEFQRRIRDVEAGFERVRLTLSFRSTSDVLDAVDRVFASEEARRGISHDPDPVKHGAIRDQEPGYVELWPSLGAEAVPEEDDWTQSVDHARAPAVRVAETVALTIKHWLDTGDIIEGKGRRLRPGDVMVLVRKRDSFVHALAKSLKDKHVPVAGADRLSLPGHIAVKDLAALGRFLIQPEDDLSLAAVLRSPIFGVSEETLFDLAADRPRSQSLDAALRERVAADPALQDIATQLEAWAGEAAFKPVFEFYSGVLGRDGVRRKMIARLGLEAGDILDEFQSFCLAEERTGLPGIEAFLATLESAGPEIKREMDQGRDEVRIMTVHAAKGLEAPVVFLVDGGAAPFSDSHLPRMMPFETKHLGWQGTGYLWRSGTDVANGFSREAAGRARERADDEYRRLLYVGMTRAEDRLVVCGYHGKRAQNPATWHQIVSRALLDAPETVELAHPVTGETVHRFRTTQAPAVVPDEGQASAPAASFPPLPAFGPLPPDDDLPRPLSPSGASILIEDAGEPVISGRSPVLDGETEPGFAIQRGLVMHKLLQMLPGLAPEKPTGAAERYLERAAGDWPPAERAEALGAVAAILEHAGFAPIFAPGSRAEVAVMGELTVRGRKRQVSGKIDRLAVTDSEVLIVDYKTNRPAPASLDAVPLSYVVQLALYRALLLPLYPGRQVSAALLFTEAPRLLTVPAAAMDAALARLTQA